jgi:hypothetical protein
MRFVPLCPTTENDVTTRHLGETWTRVKKTRARCRSRNVTTIERARCPFVTMYDRDAFRPLIAVGPERAPFPVNATPAGAEPDGELEPAMPDDEPPIVEPLPETLRSAVAPDTTETAERTGLPPADALDDEPLDDDAGTAEDVAFVTEDTELVTVFVTVETGAGGAGAGRVGVGAGGGLIGAVGGGGGIGTVVETVGTVTGAVTVGTETDVVGSVGVGSPSASAPPATAPPLSRPTAVTTAAALTIV